MYWEKEIETMEREPLERMQVARLRETLQRAKKSVHYGERFAEMGLDVDGIRTVADVEKLPLTNKEDLRNAYGFVLEGHRKAIFVVSVDQIEKAEALLEKNGFQTLDAEALSAVEPFHYMK